MKKPLAMPFLLLAAILMAAPAIAQKSGGGGGSGGAGGNKSGGSMNNSKDLKTADASNAELEDLTSKLTLTDPQKAQVKSALDGRDTQLAALKKEKLPKDEAKGKSKDIKAAANEKIRALLTPDQQKIFDKTIKKGGKKSDDLAPASTPAAAPGSPAP